MSSKISALPPGTAPSGTELVAVVQAGATVKLTALQIAQTNTSSSGVDLGAVLAVLSLPTFY